MIKIRIKELNYKHSVINIINVLHIMVLYVLVAMLIIMSSNSFALTADEKEPLKITANFATADQKNMKTVFMGKVVIQKGSLKIHANTGIAQQNLDGSRILDLLGSPVYFTQKQDDGQEISGQGNKFIYNTKTGLMELVGRASVRKGKNTVMGDTLSYNVLTHVYSAHTEAISKPSGRVTVILDQESSNAFIKNK